MWGINTFFNLMDCLKCVGAKGLPAMWNSYRSRGLPMIYSVALCESGLHMMYSSQWAACNSSGYMCKWTHYNRFSYSCKWTACNTSSDRCKWSVCNPSGYMCKWDCL